MDSMDVDSGCLGRGVDGDAKFQVGCVEWSGAQTGRQAGRQAEARVFQKLTTDKRPRPGKFTRGWRWKWA